MDGGLAAFGDTTTVKVYVTNETTSVNLLQTITFTSDCSSETRTDGQCWNNGSVVVL